MEAIGLVREVSRFSGHNVEPYNDAQVRNGIVQLNRLFNEATQNAKLQDNTPPSLAAEMDQHGFRLLLIQNEIMRGKRCLMTYHKKRLDHLRRLTKELPAFPANVREHLSKAENSFQQEYAASLSRLAMDYQDVVNIHGPLNPPKELYITVRVVKDCGIVQTEYGPLYLNAHTFHYVRKADVEHLITQGFLIHVK